MRKVLRVQQVAFMYDTMIGMLLYASLHNAFALQYLRAAVTVPQHFDRRRRLDSNFNYMLPEIDTKIAKQQKIIAYLQILTGFICLVVAGAYLVPYSLAIKNSISDKDVLGQDTEKLRTPLLVTSAFLTFFNIYSFCLILKALLLVKKWIKEELDDLRRWKCQREGLFLIYLCSFSALAIIEVTLFIMLALTPILDTLDFDETFHGNLIFVFIGFIYQ